ncbi:hypothetical protein GW17_00055406 [Ensete ventricosum]|nr:hypothetical protein GW17_00055406 [Ensete ventricosum]
MPPIGTTDHSLDTYKGVAGYGQGPLQKGRLVVAKAPYIGGSRLRSARRGHRDSAHSWPGRNGRLPATRPQGQRPPAASPQRGGAHRLPRGSGGDVEREEEDLRHSFR